MGDCTFPPLVEVREHPEFHDLMNGQGSLAKMLALAWVASVRKEPAQQASLREVPKRAEH